MKLQGFGCAEPQALGNLVIFVDRNQDEAERDALPRCATEFLHGPDLQPFAISEAGNRIDILEALDLAAILGDLFLCASRLAQEIAGCFGAAARGNDICGERQARGFDLPEQLHDRLRSAGEGYRSGNAERRNQPSRQGGASARNQSGRDEDGCDASRKTAAPCHKRGQSRTFVSHGKALQVGSSSPPLWSEFYRAHKQSDI
nr:hypothetical protein [Bosea sp. LC85]